MTDITIPPEAVEVGARAAYEDNKNRSKSSVAYPDWQNLECSVRETYCSEVRAPSTRCCLHGRGCSTTTTSSSSPSRRTQMLKPEQIPHEAMKAFYEQMAVTINPREAILAALKAWPGAHGANQIDGVMTPLILPATEKQDD